MRRNLVRGMALGHRCSWRRDPGDVLDPELLPPARSRCRPGSHTRAAPQEEPAPPGAGSMEINENEGERRGFPGSRAQPGTNR